VEPVQAPAAPAFRPNFDFLRSTEFWLNKVGIGLLLLGLAFLFKYSIEHDIINEQVRVAFGLGLGSVLLALGVVWHAERRHFSQVLLGGSVATYYITGFAAYEMYKLVPHNVAFGYMMCVTLLAFALSVRQDEVMLALIATLGGLATPFILYAPDGSLPALVTYTCAVLAGASAIYFYKGWRSLLWISYTGGWAVFTAGYLGTFLSWQNPPTTADRWALQGAALFSAFAFWALPVLRETLRAEDPDRWPHPTRNRVADIKPLAETHVHFLVISVPLLVLAASIAAWGDLVRHQTWGLAAVGAAALYFRVFLARRNLLPLAYTHAMMAVLLITLGVFLVFMGPGQQNMLLLSLAVEATALHFVSARLRDKGTLVYAHLIFVVLAFHLLPRLLLPNDSLVPVLNPDALAVLAVIALGMAASFALASREAAIAYRNAVYLAFAAWLWRELSPGGLDHVMLAWAAFALLLNVLYRRLPRYFTHYDATIPAFMAFGGVAALFAVRILSGHVGDLAFINPNTLVDAMVIALFVACAYEARPREASYVYRMAAHAGVLLLMWRELWWLQNGGSYVLVAWAAYATLWHLIARHTGDRITELAAHVPFVFVFLAFMMRIATGQEGPLLLNIKAGADLIVILLAFYVSTLVREQAFAWAYRLCAHAAVLALLWRELGALPDGSSYVVVSWAAYAAAWMFIAHRSEDRITWLAAHIPFVMLALAFAARLATGQEGQTPVVNIKAASDLAVIALALFVSTLCKERWIVLTYRLSAHVAFLALLWRELWAIPNDGNAYITLSWGIYSLVLVMAGIYLSVYRGWSRTLLYVGIITLFGVVAKLLLLDLVMLDEVWRFLLFLGFGALFLTLSYFFQNLLSPALSTRDN
jgi:uncharacterized membrane protein